jgi:hypothetical protein
MQRGFRTKYHTEPPTGKTTRELYRKFEETGCLCAAKGRGRPGPSPETVGRVREYFTRSPQKSTRRANRESEMSHVTVWHILRKRLAWLFTLFTDTLTSPVGEFISELQSSEITEGIMQHAVYIFLICCCILECNHIPDQSNLPAYRVLKESRGTAAWAPIKNVCVCVIRNWRTVNWNLWNVNVNNLVCP